MKVPVSALEKERCEHVMYSFVLKNFFVRYLNKEQPKARMRRLEQVIFHC